MRKKDSVTKPTVHLNVNIPESALKIWHIEQIEQYEDARSKCWHTYTNRNNLFGQNLLRDFTLHDDMRPYFSENEIT